MKQIHLPHLGNRIIKTTVAVFICLLLHIAVGFRGSAASAAISAIICIQPYTTDSKTFAYERVIGTLVGSVWALGCVFLVSLLPFGSNVLFAYSLIAVFVLLAMYSTVLMKIATTAGLTAIVFISIVIDLPAVEAAPPIALGNVLDTLVGVLVAIAVNIFHLPKKRHPEKLFFVRTSDLVPDRWTQMPSSVSIALNYLFNDGARICLMSSWAPAFFISQMGLININTPMIVMDGAAMYDVSENKYLDVIDIPHEHAERLRSILLSFGTFISFYTVRDRTLCIYRDGEFSQAERDEYCRMKRSPYRNYMEGNYHEEDRIAFIRVIDTQERINEIEHLVRSVLPPGMFRIDRREEAQFPDYYGLYFYEPKATMKEMQIRVKNHLESQIAFCGASPSTEKQNSGTAASPGEQSASRHSLTPVVMLPKLRNYVPEHDALILLSRLKNEYEPVSLCARFRKNR